ncbi:MAG TPA: hypothetical protein VFH51_17075, partial [Myxococcota bacterium]|nr:hypothetical protein [Myxococcota bacterium]
PTAVARLAYELALAAIVEPNLRVHDSVNINGKVAVFFDLLVGDLDMLAARLPAPHKVVQGRRVLHALSGSLARCHAAGFAHGDVKLGNALFRADGTIHLWDFGLAKPIGLDGLCHDNAGTFRAPEQYLGLPGRDDLAFDARIDAWSLGVALADFHVSWGRCPLNAMRTLARQGQWTQLRNLTDDFEAWRLSLFEGDTLRLDRIRSGGSPADPAKCWDDYFGAVADADPSLCALILEGMLTVCVDDRFAMDALHKASALYLVPADTPEAEAAAEAMKRVATSIEEKRASIFDVLAYVRRKHLAGDDANL